MAASISTTNSSTRRPREVETSFHNTGLYNIDGKGAYPYPNRGLFDVSGDPEDMGKFRAPSLRNIAVTAPYMHDGSVATLEEVIDIYSHGGRKIETGPNVGDGIASPLKSSLIVKIDLTPQEKADLLAFLKTLTDETLLTSPRFSAPAENRGVSRLWQPFAFAFFEGRAPPEANLYCAGFAPRREFSKRRLTKNG